VGETVYHWELYATVPKGTVFILTFQRLLLANRSYIDSTSDDGRHPKRPDVHCSIRVCIQLEPTFQADKFRLRLSILLVLIPTLTTCLRCVGGIHFMDIATLT